MDVLERLLMVVSVGKGEDRRVDAGVEAAGGVVVAAAAEWRWSLSCCNLLAFRSREFSSCRMVRIGKKIRSYYNNENKVFYQ